MSKQTDQPIQWKCSACTFYQSRQQRHIVNHIQLTHLRGFPGYRCPATACSMNIPNVMGFEVHLKACAAHKKNSDNVAHSSQAAPPGPLSPPGPPRQPSQSPPLPSLAATEPTPPVATEPTTPVQTNPTTPAVTDPTPPEVTEATLPTTDSSEQEREEAERTVVRRDSTVYKCPVISCDSLLATKELFDAHVRSFHQLKLKYNEKLGVYLPVKVDQGALSQGDQSKTYKVIKMQNGPYLLPTPRPGRPRGRPRVDRDAAALAAAVAQARVTGSAAVDGLVSARPRQVVAFPPAPRITNLAADILGSMDSHFLSLEEQQQMLSSQQQAQQAENTLTVKTEHITTRSLPISPPTAGPVSAPVLPPKQEMFEEVFVDANEFGSAVKEEKKKENDRIVEKNWEEEIDSRLMQLGQTAHCTECERRERKVEVLISHIQTDHLPGFPGYDCRAKAVLDRYGFALIRKIGWVLG